VARIANTAQEANYRVPWLPGGVGGGSGTGWVVSKDRLMTNAHVVSNARLLTIEREGDPRKYVGTVEHIAHDCDLAIVKVNDAAFFDGMLPLEIGGIPALESTVSVYGYPIGGERLSVTRGVVSRIDFLPYSHSVVDSHLTIQIDAAINPGNSGGPVLQDGKVVGVAFQGFSGAVAQNVGYMIPTPVIRRFLDDIKDGQYDHYMDLGLQTFPLQNPAHRRALNAPAGETGIVVTGVPYRTAGDGILKRGDILVSIDGQTIDSEGFVMLEGERVMMAEVAERKFKGQSVSIKLLREGKELDVTVVLREQFPFLIQANSYEPRARYIVFGGLVFQPLNRNLMATGAISSSRVNYLYESFVSEEIYRERPEIVVLTQILPDPSNSYLSEFREGVVDRVNGKEVRSLKELADAFAEPTPQLVVEFLGGGRPMVLERADVDAARARISARYNVIAEQYLGGEPELAKPSNR
jgi:S1-C subfamily serine protease